ncbi:MAG: thiol:disulfide interchange protein DsbA/DsbL [Arenicella sp.]|nr:thiol:disulfide interchange protein DsbA/DsbL [Arenicella sp.]
MNTLKLLKSKCQKISIVCLALLLSSPAYSQVVAQHFIKGTHYSIVESANRPGNSNETIEYFSFSCPGCYVMEAHIQTLEHALPSLNLRRVHLPFGGRKAKISQKAFVLMQLLGANQYYQDVFNRIHVDKKGFNNEQELIAFFQDLGHNKLDVTNALNSFSADAMLRKMNNEAKNNKINTVPTIIVNGKYRVNAQAIFSGGNLAELIEHLNGLP